MLAHLTFVTFRVQSAPHQKACGKLINFFVFFVFHGVFTCELHKMPIVPHPMKIS
jgi:hypothetical protein